MKVDESILDLVRRAVAEDVGAGDVTTESTIPAGHVSRGTITARVEGVVAGLDVARAVFSECDPGTDNIVLDFNQCLIEDLVSQVS